MLSKNKPYVYPIKTLKIQRRSVDNLTKKNVGKQVLYPETSMIANKLQQNLSTLPPQARVNHICHYQLLDNHKASQ